MMQYTKLVQVIKCESGNATGDERILTSDGIWWDKVIYLEAKGTGDRQGVLIDGKVFEI